jgi:hypothetical protein
MVMVYFLVVKFTYVKATFFPVIIGTGVGDGESPKILITFSTFYMVSVFWFSFSRGKKQKITE